MGWLIVVLKIIFRFSNPSKETRQDELIGHWVNWAGDDAGIAMMWGYGLEFQKNGTGINHNWGSYIPKVEEKEPFSGERTAK